MTIAEDDNARTKRLFIQATLSGLGLDQSYASQDGTATNPSAQYRVIGPTGSEGVEGLPLSTGQPGRINNIPPIVLILGVLVALYLVKA
jgi:hypothetical protein